MIANARSNNIKKDHYIFQECGVVDTVFFNKLDSIYNLIPEYKNWPIRVVKFYKRVGAVRSLGNDEEIDTFYECMSNSEFTLDMINEKQNFTFPYALSLISYPYIQKGYGVYNCNDFCLTNYNDKTYVLPKALIGLGFLYSKRNVYINKNTTKRDHSIIYELRHALITKKSNIYLLELNHLENNKLYFFTPSKVIFDETLFLEAE